jgi:phosphoenolpyruvate carboxykinase (ATP)
MFDRSGSRFELVIKTTVPTKKIYWNLTPPLLYEEVIQRREAIMAMSGPLVIYTGKCTGRSPNDKFFVREASSEEHVWWGKANKPFPQDKFESLKGRMLEYFRQKELFIQDCYGGADPAYRFPARIITDTAWQSLFAYNMFVHAAAQVPQDFIPEFTVLVATGFEAEPDIDGTRSDVVVAIHLGQKLALIAGTRYAGEIKKTVFTVLNYLFPLQGILPMHCAANIGPAGDTALFFGLSGTGKTTLSADPKRRLIGDDEHGWSDGGVFNFEGGCYAKVIRLSAKDEPQIFSMTRRFGTLLENVVIDPSTRQIDLADETITENTRASYLLSELENFEPSGMGQHPKNVIFLTADAFGVLPPISRLSPEQAMYHFLSGYTARLAGTEAGMGSEPEATFSTCFGAPFLPLSPAVYAEMLGEKISKYNVPVYLVNTGWTGGPAGIGERFDIPVSRAVVNAAITGTMDQLQFRVDPLFGFEVPVECPGVPTVLLEPRNTWALKDKYDAQARELARLFIKNFEKFSNVPDAVKAAGPKL